MAGEIGQPVGGLGDEYASRVGDGGPTPMRTTLDEPVIDTIVGARRCVSPCMSGAAPSSLDSFDQPLPPAPHARPRDDHAASSAEARRQGSVPEVHLCPGAAPKPAPAARL